MMSMKIVKNSVKNPSDKLIVDNTVYFVQGVEPPQKSTFQHGQQHPCTRETCIEPLQTKNLGYCCFRSDRRDLI